MSPGRSVGLESYNVTYSLPMTMTGLSEYTAERLSSSSTANSYEFSAMACWPNTFRYTMSLLAGAHHGHGLSVTVQVEFNMVRTISLTEFLEFRSAVAPRKVKRIANNRPTARTRR